MSYTCDGSCSVLANEGDALNDFGFAHNGKQDPNWTQVRNDLYNGRVVLAKGSDITVLGIPWSGHWWIYDGYLAQNLYWNVTWYYNDGRIEQRPQRVDSYGYYHIHWGWYGRHNGYYYSTVYNYHQQAPIVKPPTRGTDGNYQYNVKFYMNIR